MPMMHVEMFEGRTQEQKRELVRELTRAFVNTCGGRPEGIHVVLREVSKEDWGVGGELAVDKSTGKK